MTKTHHGMLARRLALNSFLNLFTGGLILCIKVAFVPLMLHTFGTELYGVLSVTWMVLANFGWLDLGFSRATAKYVAHDIALGQTDRAASWVWTAVLTQVLIGAAGALILWHYAPVIVDLFGVQQDRKDLVIFTLGLFAFSIPLDFASRSLSGVLEAGQRFDWINGLNLFNTLGTFAVYSAAIWRGASFPVIVYGLLALRAVNLVAYFVASTRVLPALRSFRSVLSLQRDYWNRASAMIRFGSWVSAASLMVPFLLYFDQWMVSIIVGVAFLPFYTVPYNLLTNLSLLPSSLSSTLFPAFSGLEARMERARIEEYFVRAHRYLLTALIPAIFVLFTWSSVLLQVWIGPEFAAKASTPLRILSLGFGVALLAPLSGALLQAIGRPDLLVKLYAIELPFNVAIVWILTKEFGIVGAAISYTIRALFETLLVWVILYRVIHFSWSRLLREGFIPPILTLSLIGLASYSITLMRVHVYMAIGATILTLAVYCCWTLLFVLDRRDKQFALRMIRNMGR